MHKNNSLTRPSSFLYGVNVASTLYNDIVNSTHVLYNLQAVVTMFQLQTDLKLKQFHICIACEASCDKTGDRAYSKYFLLCYASNKSNEYLNGHTIGLE